MNRRSLGWASFAVGLAIAAARWLVLALPHPVPLASERTIPLGFIAFLAFGLVGALIVSRRPGHPIGWIYCAAGIALAFTETATTYAQYASAVPGSLPFGALFDVASGFTFFGGLTLALTYGLLLFPDGQLPSPRWRSVAIAIALSYAAVITGDALIASGFNQVNPFPALGLVGLISTSLASVAALLVRWRRARGEEREQLKWVGAAAAVFGASFTALVVLAAQGVFPADSTLPTARPQTPFVLFTFAFLLIPIAVTTAILRYRLYDIDILIRRTLVYGATSGLLAASFFGGVLLVQWALGPFIAGNELAVAVSTLGTVALFQPLRSRVNATVDRRFYRARYDAARTVDAFSLRLRDEVDLEAVRAELLNAVAGTVRPASASVWLREPLDG